ncbi:MAG TPA: lytic transglycosylase domain-containing protein [Candidatus Saccharimonadales bacterium]
MKSMRVDFRKIQRMMRPSQRDLIMVCVGIVIALIVFGLGILRQHMQTPLPAESDQITTAWIPDTVKKWHTQIEQQAKRYNIDPNLAAIIMTMESGGYARADSGYAQGLMQITPATAKEIASRHLKTPVKSFNIWDPSTNIELGAAYLAWLRDEFGTSRQGPSWNSTVELIAAGYNGGPGAANSLEQGKGLHDTQTVVYSRDAFNMWRERVSKDSPTFDRWKERGGQALLDKAATQ